jgi:hypothetical protein
MVHPGEVLAVELAGPVTALLARGMLLGIKRRAEMQDAPAANVGAGAASRTVKSPR